MNKAIVAVGNDATSAQEAMREALSALDRAARKGVIHPNGAARSKSRLLKRYNLAIASSVATAAAAAAEAGPAASEKPAPRRRASTTAKPAEGGAAPRRATTRKTGDKDTPGSTRGRGRTST